MALKLAMPPSPSAALRHAGVGETAGRATGRSTIGKLMMAEATPKKIVAHQITS
jgi:hypothetical protein